MAELVTQFETALRKIERSEDENDNAPQAHQEVRMWKKTRAIQECA